ncbi:hypothetical protein B0H11DRAFT_1936578 [Mycena galericulata]|nr:hypothetical protein B0H11DRAFT_1936578 [Mycena galericulata]
MPVSLAYTNVHTLLTRATTMGQSKLVHARPWLVRMHPVPDDEPVDWVETIHCEVNERTRKQQIGQSIALKGRRSEHKSCTFRSWSAKLTQQPSGSVTVFAALSASGRDVQMMRDGRIDEDFILIDHWLVGKLNNQDKIRTKGTDRLCNAVPTPWQVSVKRHEPTAVGVARSVEGPSSIRGWVMPRGSTQLSYRTGLKISGSTYYGVHLPLVPLIIAMSVGGPRSILG